MSQETPKEPSILDKLNAANAEYNKLAEGIAKAQLDLYRNIDAAHEQLKVVTVLKDELQQMLVSQLHAHQEEIQELKKQASQRPANVPLETISEELSKVESID